MLLLLLYQTRIIVVTKQLLSVIISVTLIWLYVEAL